MALVKSSARVNQGIPEFQVADIVEDYPILEEARKVASQIVSISDWRTHADWHIVALHLDKQGTTWIRR